MKKKIEKVKQIALNIFCICLMTCLLPLTAYGSTIDVNGLKDGQTLWLINRNAPIDKSYYAPDLRAAGGGSYLLRERAATSYESMYAAMQAAKAGKVYLRSTYRSYDTQVYLFNSRTAAKQKTGMTYQQAYNATARFTAVPGTSEHQTGLAADFTCGGALSDSFGTTSQGKWLAANSWKYGYILRYTAAKEPHTMIGNEPWHFRYVGMPHSQFIYEKGLCLEEYIYHLKTVKKLEVWQNSTHLYEVYYFPAAEGLPTKIENSKIEASTASIYCSGDNAGGYIVTVYGKFEELADPESVVLTPTTIDLDNTYA